MPQGYKCKDSKHIANTSDLRDTSSSTATERNIDVTDDPSVERAVPAAPEGEGGIVVRHAAHHILRGINTVDK